MSVNSERIFHGAKHRQTAPFGELRDNGTRKHQGTDYGTYSVNLHQYAPLDCGIVNKVVTTETNGNSRGLYVDIRYKKYDLGLILQHAQKVLVKAGQTVNKNTAICTTGMTGKNAKGVRVSSGIHAHVEAYRISTGARIDFEKIDFKDMEVEDMTEAETRKIVQDEIKKALTGTTEVPAWANTTGEWKAGSDLGIITSTTSPGKYPTIAEVVAFIVRALKMVK